MGASRKILVASKLMQCIMKTNLFQMQFNAVLHANGICRMKYGESTFEITAFDYKLRNKWYAIKTDRVIMSR